MALKLSRAKVLRIIALLIFWLLFKFLDPIGLDAAVKAASDRLFTAITMPFHNFGAEAGRNATAVVLITDHTVDVWGGIWPARYSRHARLLEDIVDAKPKAIFVDYRFVTPRAGDDLHEFDDVLAAADRQGVPLLFTRGEVGNDFPGLPEPLTSHQTITGWTGSRAVYYLAVDAEGKGTSEFEGSEHTFLAAFDLFRRLCERSTFKNCRGWDNPELFSQPILVRHGLDLDDKQSLALDVSNCGKFAGGLQRLWQAMSISAGVLTERFRLNDIAQHCPTTLTIPGEEVSHSARDGSGTPLSSLLAGKVVFYGDDRRAEHDVVEVAHRGEVPGVMVTAAAFENLVTYGSQYFRQPRTIIHWPFEANAEDFAELIIWLGLVVFFVMQDKSNRTLKVVPAQRWKSRTRRWALPAIAVLGFAAIAFYDGSNRGSENLTPGVVAMGTLLYAVAAMVVVFVCRRWSVYSHSFFGGILILTALSIILFVINENFIHWPNGDWLGLVLLFLALREALEVEHGGFVAELESGFYRLARSLTRHSADVE